MSSLYRAIAKSIGGKYLTYAVQFGSLMVLARLFKPEQFGLVAEIQVFYVFFQLLADGGLAPAIIGLNKLDPVDRDGMFGLTILIGVALGLIFLLLTPVFVWFYHIDELSLVVPCIAVAVLFNAWSILPNALLQRQQAFYQLALSTLIGEVVALASVYMLRTSMDPVQALSMRLPIIALVNFLLLQGFSGKTDFGRPMLGWKFTAVRPLLSISGYQLAFNFVNYFSRNLDNILVGKFMGPAALGLYDRSYQLMRYPLQLLTYAMTPAIQPALRSRSHDVDYIKKVHLDLAFKLSLLGMAAATGMYFLAKPIVLIAFGVQWMHAVPTIQLLALIIPVQVVLSTSGSFYQTFGRTDLLFKCGLFSAGTNVLAIVAGVWLGTLESLCWAMFISFHVNFVQCYYVMYKGVFGNGLGQFLKMVVPAAFIVMLLVIFSLAQQGGVNLI